MITDSDGNPGVAALSPEGQAVLNAQRASVLAGSTFNRNPRVDSDDRRMPYQWSWSFGVSHQLFSDSAVSVDYVGNMSNNQIGIIDINEPINGVRPGVNVFDPDGELIPSQARGTSFQRVLQTQSNSDFDGSYHSAQFSFVKRMSHKWSGRLAYTLQKSEYTGLGSPDARRVWLDYEPDVDNGRFASDRRHVFAASATYNPFDHVQRRDRRQRHFGRADQRDHRHRRQSRPGQHRPAVQGVNDLLRPIESEVDGSGRAVINGIDGPGSFLVDMSFRYQIPLGLGFESLDLFYDIFNLFDRTNYVPPTGNRASSFFLIPQAAQFPRQMQFGLRVRF